MIATWTVLPVELPRIERRCPRCDQTRPFGCSERFRVNANGKRVDVWLIYRCAVCSATWNRSIARRVTPGELGADYEGCCQNDAAFVMRHAFDATVGASARRVPFRVECSGTGPRVRVVLPCPLHARLDRVLACGLEVSRSSLTKRFDRKALRRPVHDGQLIQLE